MSTSLVIRDIALELPLDYGQPDGAKIRVCAREIAREDNQQAPVCVFLQGGPGFEAPKEPELIPWLDTALEQFRVLLLDQRGTGRSTPVGPELCESLPDCDQQLAHLRCLRADSIVQDLEQMRQQFYQGERWFLLGQSFGGFISCHYLSVAPEALAGVMICGGLPPIAVESVDAVYQPLLRNIHCHNTRYYQRYPSDRDKVKCIVEILRTQPAALPDGGTMSAARFLDCGIVLGTTDGAVKLHALLDTPFTDESQTRLRPAFLEQLRRQTDYETNPLYVLLHEAIYCDGFASRWAASRALDSDPNFSLDNAEITFYGETIRCAMLDEYAQLRGLKTVAERLAETDEWPRLYNREMLAQNTVPVEAIVYEQDYYVDAEQSLKTANLISNCNVWLHPDWAHDSIRTQGDKVLRPLMERLLKRVPQSI